MLGKEVTSESGSFQTGSTYNTLNFAFENQVQQEQYLNMHMEAIKRLNLSEIWMVPVMHGYSLMSILGKGSFGQVIRAQYIRTGQFVAIKLI